MRRREFTTLLGSAAGVPALAVDLVRWAVTVIAVPSVAVHAARRATSTIPIVFLTGRDPIQSGPVASLDRPGGNVKA
jgi:ABC-type uncharacterized transport system substrate-binding protein